MSDEYLDVWCNQCKAFVQPVDRYGQQKHFEYGGFCEDCGEPVSVVDNPIERVEEEYA